MEALKAALQTESFRDGSEVLFADLDQMQTGIAFYTKNFELIFANRAVRNYLPDLYGHLDSGGTFLQAIEIQTRSLFPDGEHRKIKKIANTIFERIINAETMEANTPAGIRLRSTYSRTMRGTYILTTTDVTDHVVYERELAEARLEAEKANLAKSDFLANMSHEIRTPMSGVFMVAQLLQMQLLKLDQPKLSELADILISSSEHLTGVINDVLVMSKIEARQIELNVQPGDLGEMLRLFIKSQTYVAENAGLDLKLVLDPKLPKSIFFDTLRVRQCVTNLVNNALKFTPAGTVTVAVLFDPESHMVTVHVVDTGPGIANGDKEKIFAEFGQATAAEHTVKAGTGLGLSISRNLANLMGGDIKLVSKLGQGSIFSLTFLGRPDIVEEAMPVTSWKRLG